MLADTVPDLIRAAGEPAAHAYREWLDQPGRAPATRKLYGVRVRRFLHWAQSRGLALATIDAASLAAYAAEVAAAKSQHEATVYLTPVRGVLGHLARCGVLAADPCPIGQPNGRGRPAAPPPGLPLAELKRIVLEAGAPDGWQDGDEDVRAGLVLLAPLSIGTMAPAAVSRFTGVPVPEVRAYADRLIAGGIWTPDGDVVLGGDNDLDFMLDVWVATGMLQRTKSTDGDVFALADAAEDQALGLQEAPDAR